MSRRLTRIRQFRTPLAAAVFVMTLLPLPRASVDVRASQRPSNAGEGQPDPCERLGKVPGRANGLHKACEELGGGSGVARGDFNGDGIGDLAIGVPYENIGTATNTGGLNVIYGSNAGLTSTGNQFFTQDSTGVPDAAEKDDHFGKALAALDVNSDGFSDLAVGVPNEDLDIGRVQMFLGSANGLTPGESFNLETLKGVTCHCRFGAALAWGDFNGNGVPDLAIGMPSRSGASDVIIRWGDGSSSFVAVDSQGLVVLAAGDHNGDGGDDLAVGLPLADLIFTCGPALSPVYCNPAADGGQVSVFKGSGSGLSLYKTYTQGSGKADAGDQFGRSLAFGDFDNDGHDDLAIGAPFEDEGSDEDAGAVSIFYDLPLAPVRVNRTITQADLTGVQVESLDQFGWALAAGDFDADGNVDLAIGVPGEDIGSPIQPLTYFQDAGIVHVLYGYNVLGLLPPGGRNEVWHQDSSGVPSGVETGDRFGYSLSAWNFGNGGAKDLAIGVPYEDVGDKADAGAVIVLYSGSGGVSATNAQIWHQDSPGISDVASTSDLFGSSMY
jgi:hypothetical protein